MNAELTQKLLKRFPVLYQDYDSPMTQTCMCWGFDHGDGWFEIIWQLRRAIEEAIKLPRYGLHGFRRAIASNLYALSANDKVVQRVLRHAKPHVTKESYIKVFDPAVLDAMQKMQATLEELCRGQQLASSFLPIGGKLLKARRGEVAERLNAAVC